MKIFRNLLLVIGVLGLLGCIESSLPVATGKGNIRALNSAVTAPDIAFLLEQRVIGLAHYKDSTLVQQFDDLDYVANFRYQFTGDPDPTTLASAPFNLVKNNDYLFVFTGSLTNPGILTWENPIREFDAADTMMEVWFGQLSPDLGEVDVYFSLSGTLPVLGEARSTLSYTDRSPILELPGGEYELFVTSKDNPTDILFRSTGINYAARITYLISTFDGDPSITSPVSARVITNNSTSVELANVDAPPTLRMFHAAITTGPFDVYRDADFATPWIANTIYPTTSAQVDTPPEEAAYTFTDAGNVGSILLEEDIAVFNGHRTTRFLVGTAPDLATFLTVDNLRPVDESTKIRFIQTSVNLDGVDIYLVEAGSDIEDTLPRFFDVTFLGNTGYINIVENDFEIYVTTPATKDILAGPFAFSATNGDVVHFAIVDNVDPNLLDIVKYDHLSVTP